MKIAGRVAVVTGGGSGLGRAMALGLARVDGRGGQSPDAIVPLVLFLTGQDKPDVTGQTISAKEWNEEKIKT